MEAHSHGFFGAYDRVKKALRVATDRPTALREAILACRNGGMVSVAGVYGGFLDKMPIGAVGCTHCVCAASVRLEND
jgi:threonine dehydrogenase-like Zn-dependent dehydrogenase